MRGAQSEEQEVLAQGTRTRAVQGLPGQMLSVAAATAVAGGSGHRHITQGD